MITKNIELEHIGDDYIGIGYKDEYGNEQYAEITGESRKIIIALGKALLKESFLNSQWNEELENWERVTSN